MLQRSCGGGAVEAGPPQGVLDALPLERCLTHRVDERAERGAWVSGACEEQRGGEKEGRGEEGAGRRCGVVVGVEERAEA